MKGTRTVLALGFGVLLLGAPAADAKEGGKAGMSHHVVVPPEELKWTAGPPSLPKGVEMILLEGHPREEGPLTLRLKFPAGYEIPAHSHPQIEHVTVLSGTFHVGMGDKLDKGAGKALGEGGFAALPPGMNHYAWVSADTVVQLHSQGPWGITYVDAANDPRKSN